jgi:CheY-like chemotaxis protein/GGDEF domain-containing protein
MFPVPMRARWRCRKAQDMRALVVDDAPEMRELIGLLLSAGGFATQDFAESAEAAFQHLRLEDPAAAPTADFILLDIMLPGIDGIQACQRIKQDPRYRDVPVLMVTARQESASLQEAFAAGAADYIRKPVQKTELLARVQSALRHKAAEGERHAPAAIRAEAVAARLVHPRMALPTRELVTAIIEAAATGERSPAMALAVIEIDGGRSGQAGGGEAVAAAVGEILARQTGHLGDLLAHGGDGVFLVLLRRVQSPDAEGRVRRCVEAIKEAGIARPGDGPGAPVTVSAGVAWSPADTPATLRELPMLAFRALGVALGSGGDRVEIA